MLLYNGRIMSKAELMVSMNVSQQVLIAFFDFPLEIKKIIYTTSVIES